MQLFKNNLFGILTLICFLAYATHVIAGRISVFQYSQLSFEDRAGKINRFADPAGLSDPQAALLLGVTAVLFTITMLQREARRERLKQKDSSEESRKVRA